jgi:hypothetical protein
VKAILAAFTALMLNSGTAHADSASDDQRYIDMLTSQGIPITSPERARAGGLAVCEALAAGRGMDQIATALMESNPITRAQAVQAVQDSKAVYCP